MSAAPKTESSVVEIGILSKRLKTHGPAITKLLLKGVDDSDAQQKLVHMLVWKIFGFAETCITTIRKQLISVELYDVVQYAIEIVGQSDSMPKSLDECKCKTAAELKLRYYVCTDGVRWALYEVDPNTGKTYARKAELHIKDVDGDFESLAENAVKFSSEHHHREAATDASNRKRWYGFWNKDKTQAECLILVEYVLYTDSSERVHIPLLDLTLWGDAPFTARLAAWEKINEYVAEKFKGKTAGSFETVAYKNEEKPLKKKVVMSLNASASSDSSNLQGELF